MSKQYATSTDRAAREHFVKTFAHFSENEKRSLINRIMYASLFGGTTVLALLFFVAALEHIPVVVVLPVAAFLYIFCTTVFIVAAKMDWVLTGSARANAYRSTALLLSASAVDGALRRTTEEQWADLETA